MNDPMTRGRSLVTDQLLPGFLVRTEARLLTMSELLRMLAGDRGDLATLEKLTRHFHALAGLGGTYGFPAVSELALSAEILCEEILREARQASDVDTQRFKRLHAEIAAQLKTSPAEAGPATMIDPSVAVPAMTSALVVGASPECEWVKGELASEGIATTTAESIGEALTSIGRVVPDLVIVEAGLKASGAYRMIEHLRSLPDSADSLAFLVGTVSSFESRVEAVRCGADAQFDLPLQQNDLTRRIKQLVANRLLSSTRVLYVEDEPDHASFVRNILERAGHEVRICSDPSRFEGELTAFRPDLVLMDVHFEGSISGYDLSAYMRQDERHATTPLLFLTTEAESDARLKSIKAGGDDFIVKPASAPLLRLAVSSRIERARLIRAMVERDGLTGLLTHSVIMERAKTAMADAERRDQPKALVMLDIDHFKNVNDQHGHPMGDRILASLGALLRRRLRQTDAVGRYGGEEFAIVLNHLSEEEAVALVERLLAEFRAIAHITSSGETLHVTFSAGVAMVDPAESLDDWKKRADDALYVAKRRGRNQVSSARRAGARASSLSGRRADTLAAG